jgi:hypothetical protein
MGSVRKFQCGVVAGKGVDLLARFPVKGGSLYTVVVIGVKRS